MAIQVNPTISPRIITVPLIDGNSLTMQELVNQARNWEDEQVNLSYPFLLSASGKQDLGGDVKVGITVQLNNAKVAFEADTDPVSAGTSTSINSGVKLTDINAHFISDGVEGGAFLENGSDKSICTVIRVESETVLHHTQLEEGTNNTWEVNDLYRIWNVRQCFLTGGNCTAVDINGNSMSAVFPTAFTQIVLSTSSSATLQELEAIQYSSFNGGITVDIINGVPGTAYPIGTPTHPVINLSYALSIDNERGFNVFFIKNSMTIGPALNFTSKKFIGQSITKTILTIDPLANVTQSEFCDAIVTGTFDGENELKKCTIRTLNFVNGIIEDCLLDAYTITLGGGTDAYFLNCWSVIAGVSIPTIDMGGSNQNLILRNYSGVLKVQNLNDVNAIISCDMNSGQMILDETITNGIVHFRGIGSLTDILGDRIPTGTWNGGVEVVNTALDTVSVSSAVLDPQTSDHLIPGSTGEAIDKTKKNAGLIPALL